jgi:hypothetical protein
VAQFEGAFDLNQTPVCDVLDVNSLMVPGFTERLALRVGPPPFRSVLCSWKSGRDEVHGSIGFKSETCMDDSMGAAQR